jgi:hypothetical protein
MVGGSITVARIPWYSETGNMTWGIRITSRLRASRAAPKSLILLNPAHLNRVLTFSGKLRYCTNIGGKEKA